MRNTFTVIALLLVTFAAVGQPKQIGSLKYLFKKEKADSSKITLLVKLGQQYYLEKPDSGLLYASKALAIAKRTSDKQGEVHALTQVGFSVWQMGNRKAALQTFTNSLNMAGQLNDQWSIARNYDGMSCVYADESEFKTAINYGYKPERASLGELTAGIAHEIQNPLNFVNNFSEVNKEMLEEVKAESTKPKAERDGRLEINLINDLIQTKKK